MKETDMGWRFSRARNHTFKPSYIVIRYPDAPINSFFAGGMQWDRMCSGFFFRWVRTIPVGRSALVYSKYEIEARCKISL